MVLLLKCHLVPHTPQSADADLNNIPIDKVLGLLHTHGNTRRRTRHDDGASLQRRALADEADNVLDAEKQVTGQGVLTLLAVDQRAQMEVRGVADHGGGHNHGAQGREAVKALAEAPLGHAAGLLGVALPPAAGDVVGGAVAGNV